MPFIILMLIKQRIQLTQYVQALKINTNTNKNRFTPLRKRKSYSISIHNNSVANMRASTAMSETQHIPQPLRCKSVQKQTNQLKSCQKQPGVASKTKRRFHITDSERHNLSNTLYEKYPDYEKEAGKVITDRIKTQIVYAQRSTIGPNSTASKLNLAKKSKAGKQLVLNDTHFQSWINEILVQNCSQKFDNSFTLSAVKKYMIDSASLAAFGIKTSDVSRIYRSLHIYSVGFCKMLREMKGMSTKAYRNIWKVYSILLEHCSAGDFQTMIADMDNQHGLKIQQLEDELQEKQEVIEKNDELNKQKNSKIFKQIKVLREENFQLNLEKEVITNDCKDFQKAFSQEVSLRILFQDKINSVYSVYRELSDKHAILFKDFQTKTGEIAMLTEQNKKITDENTLIKKQNYGLQADNQILKQEINYFKNQTSIIQQRFSKKSSQQSHSKLYRSKVQKDLRQAQQSCKKLTKQLQNAQESNTLLRQTYHLLQLQYQQCLVQNKKLLSTLDEQCAINKTYVEQRRNLDQGLNDYQNQKMMFLLKIAEKQKYIDQLKVQIQQLGLKFSYLVNEKQLANQNIDQLRQAIKALNYNIVSMKKINNDNEELIYDQRMAIKKLQSELQLVNRNQQQADDKLFIQEKEIIELNSRKKQLHSQIQSLKKKLSVELIAKQKSSELHMQQKKQEDIRYSIVTKQLLTRQTQSQKFKQLYENINAELNNVLFEKKNLQLSYKQCLTVIENNTSVIKNINTQHTDLEEKLQEARINSKLKQIALSKKISELTKLNTNLTQQNSRLNSQFTKSKDFVHPMLFEDALSRIEAISQKNDDNRELVKVLHRIIKEGEWSYTSTLSQKDQQIAELSKKLKQTERQLTLELQYQKKKNDQLYELLDECQLKLVGLTNKQKAPIAQFKEKQLKYLQIIRQKRQETTKLLQELEIMQDQNQRLVEKINSSESQLNSQRQKLYDIESQFFMLEGEKRQLQSQRDSAIQQINLLKRGQIKLDLGDFKSGYKHQFQSIKNMQIQDGKTVRGSSAGKSLAIKPSSSGKTKQLYEHRQYAQDDTNEAERRGKGDLKDYQRYKKHVKVMADKVTRQDFAKKFKNATQYYLK